MVLIAEYWIHPEAEAEHLESAHHYLDKAGLAVSERYQAEITAAIAAVQASPETWRIVERPDIRRYLAHDFPYALYYRWTDRARRVEIYAVTHTSRKPGYWRNRLS